MSRCFPGGMDEPNLAALGPLRARVMKANVSRATLLLWHDGRQPSCDVLFCLIVRAVLAAVARRVTVAGQPRRPTPVGCARQSIAVREDPAWTAARRS
jgi:hypothetical protein